MRTTSIAFCMCVCMENAGANEQKKLGKWLLWLDEKQKKKAKAIFPICAKCETEIALRVGTAIVRVVVVAAQ